MATSLPVSDDELWDWFIAEDLADQVRSCPDGGCEHCDWARRALERKGFGYLLAGNDEAPAG